MLRCFLFLFLLALLTFQIADARKRKKQGIAPKTRFLDASVYREFPGVRGAEPTTKWTLLLIWNEAHPPAKFFWQPGGQQSFECAVQRIHAFSKIKSPVGQTYKPEQAPLSNIRKGDTLAIIPIPGSIHSTPKTIKMKQGGSLYYQLKGSTTWFFVTPTLRKAKDVMMP